ncbi:MAG: hypothetical protein ACFB50_15570 [Rubrobacteraceae bacterium]
MTSQPKRPFHPRHLVCPRCGSGVDRPCVFAGKEQAEVHCTERLKAIGDPSLRVKPGAKTNPSEKKKASAEGSKDGKNSPTKAPSESAPPTLF